MRYVWPALHGSLINLEAENDCLLRYFFCVKHFQAFWRTILRFVYTLCQNTFQMVDGARVCFSDLGGREQTQFFI